MDKIKKREQHKRLLMEQFDSENPIDPVFRLNDEWQEKKKAFIEKGMKEYDITVEFEELAEPMIKFLCDNYHPHTTIIITPTSAEILEGIKTFATMEYLRD